MAGVGALAESSPVDSDVLTAIARVQASVARFSRNDSQDIVQEALVRAVRLGVACDAEPWLRTVARRIAIDNARKAREVASGAGTDYEWLAPADGDPADVAVANETFGVVRKALDAMPARYRDALLAYVEDQETDAVAKRFGISTNATWSLLCRARARLRVELDRVGYAVGAIGFRPQRWQAEAAAGLVAATVAVVAGLSVHPASPPLERPEPVVVESVAHTPPPVPTPASPLPTVAVTLPGVPPVSTVVESVKDIAHYEVTTCGAFADLLPVGVEVTIIDEEEASLTQKFVETLPEPLRVVETDICPRD